MTFESRPPAKVNLTLRVVGRREDGFHALRSVFLRIGLCDRLRFAPGGADGSDSLSVSGLPGAPTRNNLVMQALDAIRARAEIPLPTLDAALEKSIPVTAGLGGGSSDCASAIRLAQACWGVGLSAAEELELGLTLGSDVPFFLSGFEMALVEGRGEHVSPLRSAGPTGVLLFTPDLELSTGRVFDRYDEVGGMPPTDFATEANIKELADLPSAAARLRDENDLWPAATAVAPQLVNLRDDLESATRQPWLMSGSGPTLLALYPSVDEAVEAGERLVADLSDLVANARINAVDTVGPDQIWRFPWA